MAFRSQFSRRSMITLKFLVSSMLFLFVFSFLGVRLQVNLKVILRVVFGGLVIWGVRKPGDKFGDRDGENHI